MRKRQFTTEQHYDFEDRSGTKIGEANGRYKGVMWGSDPIEIEVSDAMKHTTLIVREMSSPNPLNVDQPLRHEFSFFDTDSKPLGTIRKKILKVAGDEFWIERNGLEAIRIIGDHKHRHYRMVSSMREKDVLASIERVPSLTKPYYNVSITGEIDPRLVIGTSVVIQFVRAFEAGAGGRFTTGRT